MFDRTVIEMNKIMSVKIDNEGWLTVSEYAAQTGKKISNVYYHVRSGNIVSKKVYGRLVVQDPNHDGWRKLKK